jgi:RHS repeat-associated protein
MLSPVLESLTVETPGGLVRSASATRSVTLADASDLLSLESLTAETTVNGRTTTLEYDAATRTASQTTPEGHQRITTFDALGRTTILDLAAGLDPITTNYDAQGRVTSIVQGTQSWTYDYDAQHRAISRTDATGQSQLYTWDDANRLISLGFPDGESLDDVYDVGGNLVALIMPSGVMHTMGFTPRNFMESYTPPGGGTFTRSYDLDKDLVMRGLPSGRTIQNTFDATTGQWMGMSYPEASVAYAYHPDTVRLASVTRTPVAGTAQAVAYDYDANLLTSMAFSGVASGAYAYGYDDDFRLTDITFTSGADVVQTPIVWNDDSRQTAYGPFALVRNGPGGRTSEITDGTFTMATSYDSLGRVDARTYAVGATVFYSFSLARNSAGQIVQKVESIGGSNTTYDYGYDLRGRLTSVIRDGSAVVESYDYDLNGNRTSALGVVGSYDVQDRLMSYGGTVYTFDVDGFLESRGGDTFVYSTRGELLSATVGGDTIQYSYDGHARRVGRTDAAGTTEYLYGSPNNPFLVTQIRDSMGVLTTLYHDEDGLLFAMDRGASRYYIGTDQVGTPHVVADVLGATVETLDYDSFGVLYADSDPTFHLPIGFAGGIEDTATGLVRFGLRDYDTIAGSWMARDPVLYEGGQSNLYAYVGNDPVDLRDPLGLWCGGASGYGGLGGGMELCCKNGKCSYCIEVGFGLGGGIGAGAGDAKRDKHTGIKAELNAKCAGLGLGGGCSLDTCGNFDCSGKEEAWGYEVDTDGNVKVNAVTEIDKDCGVEGKIAAESCIGW